MIKRFINYLWATRKYKALGKKLRATKNLEDKKKALIKLVDFGNKYNIDPHAKYL